MARDITLGILLIFLSITNFWFYFSEWSKWPELNAIAAVLTLIIGGALIVGTIAWRKSGK